MDILLCILSAVLAFAALIYSIKKNYSVSYFLLAVTNLMMGIYHIVNHDIIAVVLNLIAAVLLAVAASVERKK